MNVAEQVADVIKTISRKGRVSIFNADVVSVQDDTCTINYNGLQLTGVKLCSVTNESTTKSVIKPAEGSTVGVIDVSGQLRELYIISYGEVEKTIFNGGANGGLIKISELESKLNALVSWANGHKHDGVIVAVAGGSGAPATGTLGESSSPTSAADSFDKAHFENIKVVH